MVVSHDRVAQLRRCLEALEQSEGRDSLQIIVVDNGSRDGSAQLDQEFPNTQFVRLPKNFGLTKAMNLGWRASDAEFVLFLHDDTEVEPRTVMGLADVLAAHPEAMAVCPLLVDAEGQPAPQFGEFPPDDTWLPATMVGSEPEPVDFPRGAALMVRVFFVKAIRQIDERYGQFGADAELAAQIRKASRKILLVPAMRVRHEDGHERTSAERADQLLGRAVFFQKYRGLVAGLKARTAAIFSPLLGFRLSEFAGTVAGQKIDGTQQ